MFSEPLPDVLQRAEDSTQAADRARWDHGAVDGYFSSLWAGQWTGQPGQLRSFVRDMIELASASHWRSFCRPATATERLLLEAIGYTLPTDEPVAVVVDYPSAGVRRRRFPNVTLPEEEQP